MFNQPLQDFRDGKHVRRFCVVKMVVFSHVFSVIASIGGSCYLGTAKEIMGFCLSLFVCVSSVVFFRHKFSVHIYYLFFVENH